LSGRINNPMKSQRYLIIAAGGLLIVLIIITLLVSSLLSTKQSSQQPTLLPTGAFESGGRQNSSSNQMNIVETESQNLNALTSDQSNKMLAVGNKLPFSSLDLDIGYSPLLNEFFIDKKTPQADQVLQQFLKDNGLFDLYQQHPELFVNTTQSVSDAVQQAEQNFKQEQLQVTPQNTQNTNQTPTSSSQSQQNTNGGSTDETASTLQPLVDLIKSLVNLDLGPTLTPVPTEQPGGGGGGGGPPPGGGGGNVIIPPQPWCNPPPMVTDQNGVRLQVPALNAFHQASQIVGHAIQVGNSFRSCETQRLICQRICGHDSCQFCAAPGHSYHQLGLAVDIKCSSFSSSGACLGGDCVSSAVRAAMTKTAWCRFSPGGDACHWSYGGCH